eukprot:gnl/Chilomastix_cuspidata/5447.p1 GENE.gnl/Chilomastix_cuspidata/5447~~gnl/Chilomastix_cuspidata/5447.p1  ORF type:complete len:535 (+),score=111.98 gnl/Chilomastix_cuspidata/5447:25-1629(+)
MDAPHDDPHGVFKSDKAAAAPNTPLAPLNAALPGVCLSHQKAFLTFCEMCNRPLCELCINECSTHEPFPLPVLSEAMMKALRDPKALKFISHISGFCFLDPSMVLPQIERGVLGAMPRLDERVNAGIENVKHDLGLVWMLADTVRGAALEARTARLQRLLVTAAHILDVELEFQETLDALLAMRSRHARTAVAARPEYAYQRELRLAATSLQAATEAPGLAGEQPRVAAAMLLALAETPAPFCAIPARFSCFPTVSLLPTVQSVLVAPKRALGATAVRACPASDVLAGGAFLPGAPLAVTATGWAVQLDEASGTLRMQNLIDGASAARSLPAGLAFLLASGADALVVYADARPLLAVRPGAGTVEELGRGDVPPLAPRRGCATDTRGRAFFFAVDGTLLCFDVARRICHAVPCDLPGARVVPILHAARTGAAAALGTPSGALYVLSAAQLSVQAVPGAFPGARYIVPPLEPLPDDNIGVIFTKDGRVYYAGKSSKFPKAMGVGTAEQLVRAFRDIFFSVSIATKNICAIQISVL